MLIKSTNKKGTFNCDSYPLVFEGKDEYESHPYTGEKYCFSCAMKKFPKHICGD